MSSRLDVLKGAHVSPSESRSDAPSCRLPRRQRLNRAADFRRVFAHGTRSSDAMFLVLAQRSPYPAARLGLAVAKKNLHKATARNRVKRLVRESFRTNQPLIVSLDVVVVARVGLRGASARAINTSLARHWRALQAQCLAS